MNSTLHHSGYDNQTLLWALVLSISLHIFAAIWLPNIKFDSVRIPEALTVELVTPKAPEPLPAVIPEPIPEPPKPKVMPKPVPKLEPKQAVEPPPSYTPPETANAPTPPPTITTEAPSTFTAPPPEPPKPREEDLDAARGFYSGQLTREIAKHKQYPKIAQMRGWQGEMQIDLHLDGNGNLLSSKISVPSGYEVLDKQALEMVKKAAPFPAPPDALRGHTFNILVPVSFHLE